MLAIQTSDGDLRVWSVPKPPTSGIPRVIRILRREDRFVPGRNWISWSKNGRILQFSEGETWAWDVRTKDVNYVSVPTVEFVRSIAAHGPTAALFTLGPDSTVQQYDVDTGEIVAHVRYLPTTVPPTPPEDYTRLQLTSASEDDDAVPSPVNRQRNDSIGQENARQRSDTPQSQHSRSQHSHSTGSRHSDSKGKLQDVISPSKTEKTTTSISMGAYGYNYPQNGNQAYVPSPSPGSARPGAVRKASRLRQEVVISPMTPEETPVPELFPFARARLSDIPHSQPKALDESSMTPDDLRQQMLSVVFGWDDDIQSLIMDELERQTVETQNGTILLKWMGYDSDAIAEVMGSNAVNPALDWMRLALGTLDNRPETKKLGQVFVEKMLSKGEIHLAVVALLCMGDRNDAIEVYVSRNCFMEAILLTCLLMPSDWQRQSHLVRRWGEHVVENSQQHLAIRCFSCTGMEPAEPWVSPTAHMVNQITSPIESGMSQTQMPFARPMLPPAVPALKLQTNAGRLAQTPVAMQTPPTPFRHAAATGSRITPQTGGLKLITSFGTPAKSFKFPGLKSDDMTPIQQQNVTPIAESAIDRSAMSPGGFPRSARGLGSALSAGPGISRPRLASIGETPVDVEPPPFPPQPQHGRAPPTPADSGSEREKEKAKAATVAPLFKTEKPEQPPMLLTSARYTPKPREEDSASATPQTALRPTPAIHFPRNSSLSEVQEEPSSRNGSRGRKPDLSLQVVPVQEIDTENTRPTMEPLQRPNTTQSHATTNFDMSPPDTGMLTSRMKSPSVSGRSIDQYISSLEQAHFYDRTTKSRNTSRTGRSEASERKKSRGRHQKYSEDFDARKEIPAAKRSPSSPIPMSPDDLRMLHNASVESFEALYSSATTSAQEIPEKPSKRRDSESTAGGKHRHRSRSTQAEGRRKYSKDVGRFASPALEAEQSYRGRSKSRREASSARSPSSPLPMVPSEEDLKGRPNVDPALRFVSQDRSRFQRSTSRRPERGTSERREQSPDRRRPRDRSESRQPGEGSGRVSRKSSVSQKEKRRKKRDQSEDNRSRTEPSHAEAIEQLDAMAESLMLSKHAPHDRKKELAQAELEARRLSLARRPSAPTIPMPGQNNHSKSASEGHAAPPPLLRYHTDQPLKALPRNASFYETQDYENNASVRGRPGTPRAMQRPADSNSPIPAQGNTHEEMLSSESYQLPPRTYSANKMREQQDQREQRRVYELDNVDSFAPADIPDGMPRHHAFDSRVSTSRGNSRSRTRTQSPSLRNRSRSRGPMDSQQLHTPEETPPLIIGSPEWSHSHLRKVSEGPAVIPELQHLAIPPPPPPPPAPPKELALKITPDMANAANIPLPRSAFPGYDPVEPKTSASSVGHKREKSGSESQLMGKIRGITDRMRSASKTRDNARSPPLENMGPSPYETVVNGAMGRQNLATILQSR